MREEGEEGEEGSQDREHQEQKARVKTLRAPLFMEVVKGGKPEKDSWKVKYRGGAL